MDVLASADSRFAAVELDTFNNTVVSNPRETYDHVGIDMMAAASRHRRSWTHEMTRNNGEYFMESMRTVSTLMEILGSRI
jgi:hypothetical protein